MFHPCIDLHDGKVKQIVGATLAEGHNPETHFISQKSPAEYARMYRQDNLTGGHVIMLGPGNEEAARQALAAWPGGLQVGGGIHIKNARQWLEAGASHVIITSWVFRQGRLDRDRLEEIAREVGPEKLVLDLSCRKTGQGYRVATERWQNISDFAITRENLEDLARYAHEFLIHAADVEGRQAGMDETLIEQLARDCPIPCTYAGGARSLKDMQWFFEKSGGRMGLTIGSALDIFGGSLPYRDVVALDRELESRA